MGFYNVMKKPFFGRYQRPWSWPEGADPAQWERVEFESETGVTLVGLLRRTAGAARGLIVCSHPIHVDAKGYFLKGGHAQRLSEAGYHVFLWDMNGFGESPSGNFKLSADSFAAFRTAQKLADGLPVGLYGLSAGAAYGLCALARPDHGVRAAVLEGCFTTLEEFWRPYLLPYAVLRILGLVLPQTASSLRPVEQVRALQGAPSLFYIFGDRDRATPPSMGERLMAATPLPEDQRALWIVPGAKHLGALGAAPEEYWKRVLEFFERELKPGQTA
jgi:pimeloyl-ACP methyl ester carboxylesterase